MAVDYRFRGWLLTIPRFYKDTKIKIKDIVKWYGNYEYLIFQLEKGAEDGYQHYQIYIEHTSAIKFSVLKNKCNFAHIEQRKGKKIDAYNYCSKLDTRYHGPFEFGCRPNFESVQGSNQSLKAQFINDVNLGFTDKELMIKYPTIFTRSYANEVRQVLFENTDLRFLDVHYVYGPSGTGKTSYYRRNHDVDDVYVVSDYGSGMFDGYMGQSVIVFEEYRQNIQLSLFLQYLDIYPLMLPCRYSNKRALYKTVYVVSNWDIDLQYRYTTPDDVKAFRRRFKDIIQINQDYIHITELQKGLPVSTRMELNPISSNYQRLKEIHKSDIGGIYD